MRSEEPERRRLRMPSPAWIAAGVLGVVLVAWLVSGISSAVSNIDLSSIDHLYAIIFMFVTFDAVVPIFPRWFSLSRRSSWSPLLILPKCRLKSLRLPLRLFGLVVEPRKAKGDRTAQGR